MRLVSLFVAFVLAGFLGCTAELPTTPEGDDALLGKAAQGDRSEWVLAAEFNITLEDGFDVGFVSCMNNGLGERAWIVGSGRFFAKIVETPSGNVLQNQKYELDDNVSLIGQTTGDVWTIYRYNSHWYRHTRSPDGLTYVFQPDDEWYINEATGQRIKGLWQYRIVWDGDVLVSYSEEIKSCALMGPKN